MKKVEIREFVLTLDNLERGDMLVNTTKQIVYSGIFIALGLALSIVFHSFGGQFGVIFLPLHFVVLIAGLTGGLWVGSWRDHSPVKWRTL